MRYVRTKEKAPGKSVFIFQISKQEMECLLAALAYYPLLDLNFQPLSKTGNLGEEKEKLLEEATRELHRVRKKEVIEFLANTKYFRWESPGMYRLTIAPEKAEWMLQVLNEIRVGCWINLGRPELDVLDDEKLSEEEVCCRTTMDLSGYFQMALLEAFKGA